MTATRRSSRLRAQTAESNPTVSPPALANWRKRKAASVAAAPPQPTTPSKRRAQPPAPSPFTPTPSAVTAIAEPAGGPSRARNASVARLADPTSTNAMLLSPEASRLVASRDVDSVPPSKSPRTTTTTTTMTTTQNLLEEACNHLIRVDERTRLLIEKNPCRIFSPEGLAETIDPFESLASGIISQQVSGAAAKSIKAKFVALFGHEGGDRRTPLFPHPFEVARCPLEKLRTAGLSQRKAEYIQGLAEKFASGELSAEMLCDAPYNELVEKLVAVRGLGRWSVEMFACFGLKRMDVFSVGDLGVQRGMAAFVGRDVAKLKSKRGKWKYMTEREMLELSTKFAPYRSLFMLLMWRVEDSFTDVSTLE